MTKHTPTVNEVGHIYALHFGPFERAERHAEFDRMLAGVRAETRREVIAQLGAVGYGKAAFSAELNFPAPTSASVRTDSDQE